MVGVQAEVVLRGEPAEAALTLIRGLIAYALPQWCCGARPAESVGRG